MASDSTFRSCWCGLRQELCGCRNCGLAAERARVAEALLQVTEEVATILNHEFDCDAEGAAIVTNRILDAVRCRLGIDRQPAGKGEDNG